MSDMDFNIPEGLEIYPSVKGAFNDWLEARIADFERAIRKDAKGIRMPYGTSLLLGQLTGGDGSPTKCDYRFSPYLHRPRGGLLGWFNRIPVQHFATFDADRKTYISISDEQYPYLEGEADG